MAYITPVNRSLRERILPAIWNQDVVANTIALKALIPDFFPPGALIPYAGPSAPTGWLLCYGQAVSRSTFVGLFTIIGVTYGVGDGSTTFNLPDMRGRIPVPMDNMGGVSANVVTNAHADTLGGIDGEDNHVLTIAEMPAHNHGVGNGTNTAGGNPDAWTGNQTAHNVIDQGGGTYHNNMPPYIAVNYLIKT